MTMSDPAPLMLSVSGARGIVDASMTEAVAARFAAAWGSILVEESPGETPHACLGRDSRPSGEKLAVAAALGLNSAGCNVIDLGLVTTPTVGVMTTATGAAGGMVVTASHNPNPWNGLKCIDASGAAPPPEVAEELIARFKAMGDDAVNPAQGSGVETEERGNDTHLARVLGQVDPGPIQQQAYRVVLDSVNGAGCVPGRRLLELLGCEVKHLNGEPTGDFAHVPEPTEANLLDLASETAGADAAIGFAQDPDADRLAIIDEQGRYLGEEYTLAIVADFMLRAHGGGTVVTNLSTSRMVDDLAARHGGRVVRTAVGEANVVAAMREHDALIGGEGNGGVILPGVCSIRDSLGAMALVLASIAESGSSVSELVGTLPSYAMVKSKVDLPGSGGAAAVAPVLQKVREVHADASVDTSDGVRVDFEQSWVHVRPSNTEPIARIIAEAPVASEAEALVQSIVELAGWDAP
ncbi:MAG: phosphoglucosamine mutase [Planctomycetota bacterium]|nr:phosphoglucosamine mutase [Planctomycetota bacterium]